MAEPLTDPFEFELFKNSILSVADEMALTVHRTTYSNVLRDNLDYSTAFFDAEGLFACPADELRGNDPTTLTALRLALLVEGIDIAGWPGGMISATHDNGCVERAIAGFRSALHSLMKDNVLPA